MPEIKLAADAVVEENIEKNEESIEENGADSTEETVETIKSPYQEEAERLEAEAKAERDRLTADIAAEKADKERISKIKDKALADEKEKTRSVKESWKSELKEELRQERLLEKAQEQIESLTEDPAARKVIMHHYQTSIVRTGNIANDISMALAIANRKHLDRIIQEENMNDERNSKSIASMGGGDLPGGSSFKGSPSATAQAASRMTGIYAGKDKIKAKKLADRASNYLR